MMDDADVLRKLAAQMAAAQDFSRRFQCVLSKSNTGVERLAQLKHV
jgi:hypothetical protein